MRTCGDCTVCCFIGGVPALNKAAHSQCPYLDKGCSIFESDNRPKVCSSFKCLWLQGMGLPEDRPDLSGVMCSANKLNGGSWVFAIETKQDAAMTTGRNMIERITSLAITPVIIVNYDAVPPDDKGDRVVVKAELESRSSKLCGSFLHYLDKEKTMGVYELVVH